ncbi:MAG: RHS repeat-associated core domain-containing protein [Dehalococcoidia bacterium]
MKQYWRHVLALVVSVLLVLQMIPMPNILGWESASTITLAADTAGSIVYSESDPLTSSSVNTQNTAFAGDIVFAIDESGSMQNDISDVKDNVQFIADELSGIVDARYGLVGFGATAAHRPDAADGAAHIHTTLTDLDGFTAALNELVADGWFEPGLSATILGMSSQMNFRAGAVPIIVLITDEDADDPWNLSAALQSLQDRNATWFGIVLLGYGNTADTYGPNPGSLSVETGGQVFSIYDFRADPQPVLEAIFDTIIGTVVTKSPARTFGSPGSNPYVAYSDDPVNLATGNFIHLHQDLYIPTRGHPLQIVRSYNSLDAFHGPFGRGWTFNYGMSLTFSLDGDVILMTEEGRRDFYRLNPDGTFTPPLGIYSTLTKNLDGTYTLRRKSQSEWHFDATGRLAGIADKNGNQSTMSYDASGNLVSVTGLAGRSLTFTYDTSGHIVAITDPAGRTVSYIYDADDNLVQYSDANGGQYAYTYDAEHRMTTFTDPVGNLVCTNVYDSEGRVVSQTNALGAVTIFTYDPANRETIEIDPLGRQTTYVYDEHCRLVSQTDALGNTAGYTYDEGGNRSSVTDANGHTTDYEYDTNGNMIRVTDALGNMTCMAYDPKNNLVSRVDALGRAISFGYDASGNLVEVTGPLGGIATFAYDVYGQLIHSTDANGNASSFACDVYGNRIAMMDALGNTTIFTYDIVGRLLALSDALGNTSVLHYDLLDRVISITDPLGHSINIGYDGNGNRVSVTDANGYTTEYSYDALNQLVGVTDPRGGTASYTYDTVGNTVAITDTNGHITTYEYNACDLPVKVADPLGHTTTFHYDPVGNLIAMTDAKGQATAYTYDPLNRLTCVTYDDGTSVIYVYDAVGNRIQMIDSTGTTAYGYDSLDRLTSILSPSLDTVAYSYDLFGNRVSLTYPDGDAVTYEYDALNRPSVVTDWAGRTTTYTYDAVGNVIGVDYPNGASIDYAYDEKHRLLRITNSDHRGPFADYAYTMDKAGNRISVTDIKGNPTLYSYDNLYRLTGAAGPESDETYTYDDMGNRLTLTADDITTTYVYDTGDRLLSMSGNGKVSHFSYDENGNLVQKAEPGLGRGRDKSRRVTSYIWNAANRLIEVFGTGPTSCFTYDGDGNRVKMVVGDDEFDYVWDVAGGLPAALVEHGPQGTTKFVYGLGLISAEGSDFLNFYHYDGLGSVIGLTNEEGQKKREYRYDAWGNSQVPPGLLVGENKFAFTGQQHDSGTNLLYLRARYYDPTIGRFISRDPMPGYATDSRTLNRYVYTANNPATYVDPSGLYRIIIGPRVSGGFWVGGELAFQLYYDNETKEIGLAPVLSGGATYGGSLELGRIERSGDPGFGLEPDLAGTATIGPYRYKLGEGGSWMFGLGLEVAAKGQVTGRAPLIAWGDSECLAEPMHAQSTCPFVGPRPALLPPPNLVTPGIATVQGNSLLPIAPPVWPVK